MSAASIALEVAEVEGQLFSAQTLRRHSRRKPLLKLAHKKGCKQFAEDNLSKSINYWNHVLWSDETRINLFGSDGVQYGVHALVRSTKKIVLPTVKQVASWSGAA